METITFEVKKCVLIGWILSYFIGFVIVEKIKLSNSYMFVMVWIVTATYLMLYFFLLEEKPQW